MTDKGLALTADRLDFSQRRKDILSALAEGRAVGIDLDDDAVWRAIKQKYQLIDAEWRPGARAPPL